MTFDDKMSEEKLLREETELRTTARAGLPSVSVSGDLLRVAADPNLTEDLALALLKRADLPAEVLDQVAKNSGALKGRKVKFALACHPNTPRRVSVPLARQFYTFDLMKVALSPSVPADVKVAAEDALISRLKTVTTGERLTLARRASGRVAAALLLDADSMEGKARESSKMKNAKSAGPECRVMQTALENPRLTEALIISSVLRPAASEALVAAVALHPKWSYRREIRAALLRTEHLSMDRVLEFSHEIPVPLLRELLSSSRLPDHIKDQLLRENPHP